MCHLTTLAGLVGFKQRQDSLTSMLENTCQCHFSSPWGVVYTGNKPMQLSAGHGRTPEWQQYLLTATETGVSSARDLAGQQRAMVVDDQTRVSIVNAECNDDLAEVSRGWRLKSQLTSHSQFSEARQGGR